MKIKSFYITSENVDNYINDNFLGNKCLVYQLNIQACPGTKFQIGDNVNSFVLIGGSGSLKLECEKYPIDCIKIIKTPGITSYPIIIDIVYKGEIPNE